MKQATCKTCRRVGEKLFLKGEKCMSSKCPMVQRPYAPGQKPKKRRGGLSEYGKELREKQRIKKHYYLSEKQFKGYVKEVLDTNAHVEDVSSLFIQKIETRLDNIIYRLGWARSRAEARQIVTHGHFMVNGKRTDIPSQRLRINDVVMIREGSKSKAIFKDLADKTKKVTPPSWLKVNQKTFEVQITKLPVFEDVQLPGELSVVFEHYSR
jgi:small subunit ribosomal protein S4